jgi:putative acetyltransferase
MTEHKQTSGSSGLLIRRELPSDLSAIHRVVESAFGQPAEAKLIDALRTSGHLTFSLVAVRDDEVIGHIAFSPVTVGGMSADPPALALAPVAVLPPAQRSGAGSALIRFGLDEARRLGHPGVIVLGHAEYYPRFGFSCASQFGITCPFEVPDDHFMAIELKPGGLAGCSGVVGYRPEFMAV